MTEGDYTYQKYLDEWEALYGDALSGETEVWVNGHPCARTRTRMTEVEFNAALAVVDECMEIVGNDQLKPADQQDFAMQDRYFAKSFPYEVQLLI